MSAETVRERIERLNRQTSTGMRERRMAADGPPRPGDLFVLPLAEDLGAEWVLVEAIGGIGGARERFRAVAADTHPLIGSRDLEVPAEHPGGPLAVRCGLCLQLGAEHLPAERRTGRLDAMTLGRIRRKVADLEHGVTPEAAEVDAEAEYRQWMASLEQAAGSLEPSEDEAAAAVESWPSRRQLAWAAAVLLVVSLALTGGLVHQASRRDTPVANAPFAVLTPLATVRGEAPAVTVGQEDTGLLLIFGLAGVPTFERYRLEMYDATGSRLLWSSDDLRRTGVAELTLVLPRSMLAAGEVRFSLFGISAGELPESAGEPLARYALVFATEP